MNEFKKINVNSFAIIFIALLLVFAGGITGFIFGSTNPANSSGIESNLYRERELLKRIGEYEQRERDRVEAERIRIAAENSRIERERARIERTKTAIGAIRESDRRSGSLLQELEQEINILADYFRDSRNLIGDFSINLGSE